MTCVAFIIPPQTTSSIIRSSSKPQLIGKGGIEEKVSVENAVVGPTGVSRLAQGLKMIMPTCAPEQICCICVGGAIDMRLLADGFLPGNAKAVLMICLDYVTSFL